MNNDVIEGVGQLGHQPRGQSRELPISLTSFAWNGDGATVVAAAGMGSHAHMSEPIGN